MKKATKANINKAVRTGTKLAQRAATGASALSKKAVRVIKKNAPTNKQVRKTTRTVSRVVAKDAIAIGKKVSKEWGIFSKFAGQISDSVQAGIKDAQRTSKKRK